MFDDNKPTLDDALEHFGVKGMRWGVRKASNTVGGAAKSSAAKVKSTHSKLQAAVAAGHEARIQRLERVAAGKGAYGEKTSVFLNELSLASVARNKGIAGAAGVKAANMRARDARKKVGESTAKDILARFGGDHLATTGKVDSGLKFTPAHEKIAVQPYHSTTTKKVINDHNNLSNHDFFRKYATTKKTYAKRVQKHGDPFTKSRDASINKKAPVIVSKRGRDVRV